MDGALFQGLLADVKAMGSRGVGAAGAGAATREPDVKALREVAGVSQAEFASLIGVSRRTLENWEQHRARPTGPARALLKIVASNPRAAVEALHS